MTATTPLLIAKSDDEEDEEDSPKITPNPRKEHHISYSQSKCLQLKKITVSKVKGFFADHKFTFDLQYFLKNRKYVALLMLSVLAICYINSGGWNENDRITVIHHSHVPGMKGKLEFQEI